MKKQQRELKYSEALAEGLAEAMANDPTVFLMGQSGDDPKGMFGTLSLAQERFGLERFLDLPLSEAGITGWGTGAAIGGLKPVMTHHRNDFLLVAADQIINHAAKWMYMHRTPVPWTIRSIIGRGWGQAPQHSQSLQAIFAHIPGLKIIMPATPYDAKGLLITAIDDLSPVIVLEHRRLYDQVGPVPEGYYKVPIGKAKVIKTGTDLTIVAISQMLMEANLTADALEKAGVKSEIIDLRSIRPLDINTILNSIKKTGRLIICDTGGISFGVSAEIAAQVADKGFSYLKAPIQRVGLPDCPTPASFELEKYFYPGAKDIFKKALQILAKEQVQKIHQVATTNTEMSKFIGIF